MSTASKIREIRLSLGMSMTDFGKAIDKDKVSKTVKSGTVSNWETGKNLPNKKRLKRIAKLGNVPVNELINDDVTITKQEYERLKRIEEEYLSLVND